MENFPRVSIGSNMNRSHSSIDLAQEKQKVQTLLKVINNSKGEKNGDRVLSSYLEKSKSVADTGEATLSSFGDAMFVLADAAQGLKEISLGLYTIIDSGKAINSIKDQQQRKRFRDAFSSTLKKSSSVLYKSFKKKDIKHEINKIDNSNQSLSNDDKMGILYKNTLNKLLEMDHNKNNNILKDLKLLVEVKEYLNNNSVRENGFKYGFLSKALKKGQEMYEINLDRIPDSIREMKEEIDALKNSEHRLGQNVGHKIKELNKTIDKLKLIQVFEGLKKINNFSNKRDSSESIISTFKAIGDALGTAGGITTMTVVGAPIGLPIFVSGVTIRATSTLVQFMIKKFQTRQFLKKQEQANTLDKNINHNASSIIGDMGDPIIAEKFPGIAKLIIKTINDMENINDVDIGSSLEEKIVNTFKKNIKENINTDPNLRNEWDMFKHSFDVEHDNNNIDLRRLCDNYIEQSTEFIMSKIKSINELETCKKVDEVIDTMIEIKEIKAILELTKIKSKGFIPEDFILKTIDANKGAEFSKNNIVSENLGELNNPKEIMEMFNEISRLVSTGMTQERAAMHLAVERQKRIEKQTKDALDMIVKNSGVKDLALLENTLKESFI